MCKSSNTICKKLYRTTVCKIFKPFCKSGWYKFVTFSLEAIVGHSGWQGFDVLMNLGGAVCEERSVIIRVRNKNKEYKNEEQ